MRRSRVLRTQPSGSSLRPLRRWRVKADLTPRVSAFTIRSGVVALIPEGCFTRTIGLACIPAADSRHSTGLLARAGAHRCMLLEARPAAGENAWNPRITTDIPGRAAHRLRTRRPRRRMGARSRPPGVPRQSDRRVVRHVARLRHRAADRGRRGGGDVHAALGVGQEQRGAALRRVRRAGAAHRRRVQESQERLVKASESTKTRCSCSCSSRRSSWAFWPCPSCRRGTASRRCTRCSCSSCACCPARCTYLFIVSRRPSILNEYVATSPAWASSAASTRGGRTGAPAPPARRELRAALRGGVRRHPRTARGAHHRTRPAAPRAPTRGAG